jgi:RNA polymerase sigma-70 factor (ECF subfamily)
MLMNSAPQNPINPNHSHTAPTTEKELSMPHLSESQFRDELTALIPHLRAFARSLCGNAALADDIAQDAMLKAWKARERFKPGTNMKAWTFTILRNQFYTIKRRSWRATSLEQNVAEETIMASESPDASVRLNELRYALGALSDDQREALILVGASGMSYEEAAEICGVATGTIKSRVSRARKTLEGIMKDGNFDKTDDGIGASDAIAAILEQAKHITKN